MGVAMAEGFRAFGAAWSALWFWAVHSLTLIRLVWFPFALLGLVGYGWAYWNATSELIAAQARAAGGQANPFFLPYQQGFEGHLIWALLQLIVLSSTAVAVHRFVIAGERRPGQYFAFAFGKAELGYFAMGVIAYVLVALLLTGQFLAQFSWPPFDDYVFSASIKPFSDLGPLVLSLFIWPGEQPVLDLPPATYAAWCALAIATGALLIRIAPWPAAVAAEQGFALRHALALTHGRTLTVVAYLGGISAAMMLGFAVLVLAGLSSIAAAGFQDFGSIIAAMGPSADWSATAVENTEIRSILRERDAAAGYEIGRFIMGVLGVTLGATLLARLYCRLSASA